MKSKGITYFPMDTEFKMNMKIFHKKFGAQGIGAWLLLIMTIQKEGGYGLEFNIDSQDNLEELAFVLSLDEEFLKDILLYMLKKNIFDNEIYTQYKFLTSRRLQNNFMNATRRRKGSSIKQEFNLLKESDFAELKLGNVGNNNKIVDSSRINVDNNNENVSSNVETVDTFEQKKVKDTIPYKKIIDFLNKETGGVWRYTTKATKDIIRTRWNEGFKLKDFYLCIGNAWDFRKKEDNPTHFMAPKTIFNGSMESRVNGSAYVYVTKKIKNEKSKPEKVKRY